MRTWGHQPREGRGQCSSRRFPGESVECASQVPPGCLNHDTTVEAKADGWVCLSVLGLLVSTIPRRRLSRSVRLVFLHSLLLTSRFAILRWKRTGVGLKVAS